MAHQSINSYDGRILKTFEELTDQQFDTERLLVGGSHDTVDAWVGRTKRPVTVLLTSHALPRHQY